MHCMVSALCTVDVLIGPGLFDHAFTQPIYVSNSSHVQYACDLEQTTYSHYSKFVKTYFGNPIPR